MRTRKLYLAIMFLASAQVALAEHNLSLDTAETSPSAIVESSSQPFRVVQDATGRRLETANFLVQGFNEQQDAASWAQAFEGLRSQLYTHWLPEAEQSWRPKCLVVIHDTDAEYEAQVGRWATCTIGVSYVGMSGGKVTKRRIDVRSRGEDWFGAAVAHELTHIILADRFPQSTFPLWADEGMAVLADSAEKQGRHFNDFSEAFDRRDAFRMVELLSMRSYPSRSEQAVFYGQSASLVTFLVNQATPAKFLEFLELAEENGYDASLRTTYGIDGVSELERRWRAHMVESPTFARNVRLTPPAARIMELGIDPHLASNEAPIGR